MIWSVKHLGDFEKEEALFTTARLEDHKGQASCFSINIEAPVSGEALESAVKDLQAKIMEHAMAGEAPPPELLELQRDGVVLGDVQRVLRDVLRHRRLLRQGTATLAR